MTEPQEYWVLNDGHQGLLFNRATMRLVPIETDTADVLGEVLKALPTLGPSSPGLGVLRQVLGEFDRQAIPELLSGLSPPVRASLNATRTKRVDAQRYLNKLAINISNDCNLACTYCYANEGLYGNPERSLLHPDEIERIIERFATRFDYIAGVQFMGGEPSLNPAALDRAGNVFERLVKEGRLLGAPAYTAVTNGLSFKQSFLEVCRRLDIELTVSLDGPELVHDAVRVRRGGSGSYNAVRRNIERAIGAGVSVEFEPTFSRAHLRNGMGLVELVEWFYREFGVRTLHAPPMSENRHATADLGLSPQEKIREYCAVTEWGIDNVLDRKLYLMHSYTARILASLESRTKNSHLCPAGVSLLSVSTSGEVSPCWMYTDEPNYAMGHVAEEQLFGDRAKHVLDTIDKWELQNHPECKRCMIQPLCFGCKGGDFHATGTASRRPNCDYMRAMVATAMMRLFSREHVPDRASAYYERHPYGMSAYEALRPVDVEWGDAHPESQRQGLVQLRVAKRSVESSR